MNDPAQGLLIAAAIGLGVLLAVRLLIMVPGWIRRTRRPETRSTRVIGVGGAGGNAVDRMVEAGISGVDFIACNTDAQALRRSSAGARIRIGASITRGLGAGGDPGIGRESAEDDLARIAQAVSGADLVFVLAGLGGGTGSGAAPIVGAAAREQGSLTIAIVTTPFAFEGARRRQVADEAVIELAQHVDAIITIANDAVGGVVTDDAPMLDAFRVVDDVLLQVVRGILDLLDRPGLVNLDFADVRTVLQDAGPALIGLGSGRGEDRAIGAARQAIASPLLDVNLQGARSILLAVTGPPDLRLREVRLAAEEVRANADPDANVIFGASLDGTAGDEVVVTLVATGLTWPPRREVSVPTAAGAAVPRRGRRRTGAPSATLRALHEVATAMGPRVSDAESLNAVPADDTDLEVPSFLRRRQPG